MSTLPALNAAHRARSWAWWLLPAVALGALIGWEIDWGRHLLRAPSAPAPIAPKPVESAVLPEYSLEGGLAMRSETVNRTLFNPTRRPAPVLAAEGGLRRIQPGQFLLVGTAVTGDRKIAFLKEVSGGKARTVRQGDEINGMQVALVAADRVKLTAGDESEELTLKVARGPKTTLAAAPPPPGAPVAASTAAQPAPAQAAAARAAGAAAAAVPPPTAVRRAARRAAAKAGQDANAAQPDTATPPAPQQPGNTPPSGSWDSVYQNMQRQRQR
jgi:hypothetical protein